MKKSSFPLLFVLLALPMVAASAATVVNYTDGSQVNLLNAYNASMSGTGTISGGTSQTPDQARFSNSLGFQPTVRYTPASNPALTMDFGTARTVKTLTDIVFDANSGFTSALVETSNDGTNWTTQTNVVTNPNSVNTVVTLNSAVSARYVRLTPTAFQSGTQVEFGTVRAFGSTGSLAGDSNLSIFGNVAGMSVTAIGSGTFGPTNISSTQLLAPATEPATQPIVQFMGNNMGFKVDLTQTYTLDRGALSIDNYSASLAQPLVLTITGSTNDSLYTTLSTFTFTSNPSGFNLFNYAFDAGATDVRYLKYVFTTANTGNINMQVGDFELYQVPEPSTVALGAIGLAGVFYRLRRKQRSV